VTIADPIVGGRNASVVKNGKGTLVLAAPDNVIPGGVTIEEGALGWSCDGLSLTSLDFRDGAKLAPPLKTTGEFAMLTVSNNVDITGVSFAAFDATADESLRNNPAVWLAVPEGCRITGVPNSRGWRCRVIEFNGSEALEVQYLGGFAISIR
jgi:autotransporter-associated beta strand protein